MNKWNELTSDECKEVVASKYQGDEGDWNHNNNHLNDKPWRLHEAIVECGFKNIDMTTPVGPSKYVSCIYADSEKYRFWFYPDKSVVWIGVKASFDRWANSRDFVAGIPQNQEELDWLLAEVDKQVEVGNYDAALGKEKRLAPNPIREAEDAIEHARRYYEVHPAMLKALESVLDLLKRHAHVTNGITTSPPKF